MPVCCKVLAMVKSTPQQRPPVIRSPRLWLSSVPQKESGLPESLSITAMQGTRKMRLKRTYAVKTKRAEQICTDALGNKGRAPDKRT